MPPPTEEEKRRRAERRKKLAIEDVRRSQGFMQLWWMYLLRRFGFGFQAAYHTATAIAWSWYAWQRVKIELAGRG